MELVFHQTSRHQIKEPFSKISEKPNITKNALLAESLYFLVASSWKKLARIGFLKEKDTNFTDCKTGEPIAPPGLNVAGGILYVTDPKKIPQGASNNICLGSGSRIQLEIQDRSTCHGKRWCSEYETEKECEEACHSVTGEIVSQEEKMEIIYLQENLAIGNQATILPIKR